MAKKSMTKEQYVGEVRGMATYIGNQGTKLAQIGRFLATTPDYSTETARECDNMLEELKNIVGCLKKVKAVTLQRGLTALDEEEVAHANRVEEKRRQLMNGTLRIDRRVSDQAAE